MQMKEAWAVLGLPSNATPLQIKLAYKQKALENHPDRFPPHVKLEAEARFKHVIAVREGDLCMLSIFFIFLTNFGSIYVSKKWSASNIWIWWTITVLKYSGSSSWVNRGRRVNVFVASAPFALLIAGTLALGFSRAARAYRKQQKESPARNPFLP